MKKTKLLLWVVFIFNMCFVFISDLCGQGEPLIEFNKVGKITGTEDHFLGSPIEVEVMDGQIFIADRMDLKIKVFSREGTFIREMGGRGRGPGEFQHFTAMWKDAEGKHIKIVDYVNRKVVTFAKNGSLVDEKLMRNTKIIWPRTIHPLSDTAHLILYQSLRGTNKELFHIWDNNFNTHKRFLALPPNLQNDDLLKEVYRGLSVGSSLVVDSTLYFAPIFYEGNIYSRNWNAGDSWTEIQGVNLTGDSYESLNLNGKLVNEDGEQVYDYRMRAPEDTFVFRLYNTTKALFITQDSLIAHFVEIRENDKKEHGIEIYDASGTFIGYQSYFQEVLKEDRYTLIPEYPKAIDEENRVYTINRKGEVPVISIYQLRVDY